MVRIELEVLADDIAILEKIWLVAAADEFELTIVGIFMGSFDSVEINWLGLAGWTMVVLTGGGKLACFGAKLGGVDSEKKVAEDVKDKRKTKKNINNSHKKFFTGFNIIVSIIYRVLYVF